MSILEQLVEDQNTAMRAKEKLRLGVIRYLRSELKNAEIAKKQPLTQEEVVEVLQREIKRRKEVLADYERAQRPELLTELKEEINIIKNYLPPQMTETEIREIARNVLEEQGVTSKKEFGKVMKAVMSQVKGKADGALVKKVVENMLE